MQLPKPNTVAENEPVESSMCQGKQNTANQPELSSCHVLGVSLSYRTAAPAWNNWNNDKQNSNISTILQKGQFQKTKPRTTSVAATVFIQR